jgi:hypothetical protein
MVDSFIASESVTVLGGPIKRDVSVNIGAPGERGSNIFVGSGNPNSANTYIPRTPQIFDMFINLAIDDSEYLFLYQYLSQNGVSQWVRLLRLIPNTFLTNKTANFVNGQAVIDINVIDVVALFSVGTYTANNFNIQHTVINDMPVASAISVPSVIIEGGQVVDTGFSFDPTTGLQILPITVSAAEFNPVTSTWSPLSGVYLVDLFLTVV